MKRSTIGMVATVGVFCASVILAAVLIRHIGASAYADYCARGGEKGFWSWLGKDVCGVPLAGVVEEAEEPPVRRKAAAEKAARRAAEFDLKIARLEAMERAKMDEIAASLANERRIKKRLASKGKAEKAKRRANASKRRGGSIDTGGKSTFVAGDGKTPYRVNGIRGIAFGSTENAPADGVRPVMSVWYDETGNEHFGQLRWQENKNLTDPVYGFEKAYLKHSIESEQLASVTFNKIFPFTEEGMARAVQFYQSMAAEASADLGFEVIDVDKTGNFKSATICEFKNGDGDTSIRGAISAWSDKSLTVTFSVSDKAYSRELKQQSRDVYASGMADSLDARIQVSRQDYTDRKTRILDFME